MTSTRDSTASEPLHQTPTFVGMVYTWAELHEVLNAPLIGGPLHIDVIRHGESVANARGLVAGKWDTELSVRGMLQAYRLALCLKSAPYMYVWSSSLSRSSETLQCAARLRRVSFKPMCKDGRLDERSLGELEKKPRRFIPAYSRGDLRYAPPGGESYLQLTQRVLSFLLDLRKTITDESYILLATHVGPMRIIAGVLEEMKKPADVLGLNFTHARPYRFDLSRLKWPQFLNAKEVLDDRAESTESCRYTEISSTLYQ